MNSDQVHLARGADSMVRNSDLERGAMHTPGPWVAEKRTGDEWWFGGRDGMEIVVRPAADPTGFVCVIGATLGETSDDHNARLIAAAPGLLIATECALALGIDPDKGREVLERHGFKWGDDTSPYSPTYRADKFVTELCRAAISRATQPTKGAE